MSATRPVENVLVWDFPTRAFHWMLALSFALAYLTSESERFFGIHLMSGITLAGLIVFRLLWGIAGTRYARFSALPLAPAAVIRYLKSLLGPKPEHYVGHNPAGSIAIVLLLVLGLASALSGLAMYLELAGDGLEDVHEFAANAMLAVVLIHIAGVVVSSFLHRENLVGAMLSGYKRGSPGDAAGPARRGVAMLLLVAVAGLWASYGAGVIAVDTPSVMQERHDGHDGDRD